MWLLRGNSCPNNLIYHLSHEQAFCSCILKSSQLHYQPITSKRMWKTLATPQNWPIQIEMIPQWYVKMYKILMVSSYAAIFLFKNIIKNLIQLKGKQQFFTFLSKFQPCVGFCVWKIQLSKWYIFSSSALWVEVDYGYVNRNLNLCTMYYVTVAQNCNILCV